MCAIFAQRASTVLHMPYSPRRPRLSYMCHIRPVRTSHSVTIASICPRWTRSARSRSSDRLSNSTHREYVYRVSACRRSETTNLAPLACSDVCVMLNNKRKLRLRGQTSEHNSHLRPNVIQKAAPRQALNLRLASLLFSITHTSGKTQMQNYLFTEVFR